MHFLDIFNLKKNYSRIKLLIFKSLRHYRFCHAQFVLCPCILLTVMLYFTFCSIVKTYYFWLIAIFNFRLANTNNILLKQERIQILYLGAGKVSINILYHFSFVIEILKNTININVHWRVLGIYCKDATLIKIIK